MKLLFAFLIGLLGMGVLPSAAEPAATSSQFIFVKIPENIEPIARGVKYEDPLGEFLEKNKIGEVTGGGTKMSAPNQEGKRSIEYVGVDVELSDFKRGLPLLKAELLRLGAPAGTVLEYTRAGKKLSEPVN